MSESLKELLDGAENMEWACREVGKEAIADFIAELTGALKQQQAVLRLAEEALLDIYRATDTTKTSAALMAIRGLKE